MRTEIDKRGFRGALLAEEWRKFYKDLRCGKIDLAKTTNERSLALFSSIDPMHDYIRRTFLISDYSRILERILGWQKAAIKGLISVFVEQQLNLLVYNHIPLIEEYDGSQRYYVLEISYWDKVLSQIQDSAQEFINKNSLNQKLFHKITADAIPWIEGELIREGIEQMEGEREEEDFRAQHAPGRV